MTRVHDSPENARTTGAATAGNIALLAGMLERMERSGRPIDPLQYRLLAQRLEDLLALADRRDPAVDRLLRVSPVAAESYENVHYPQAGLCLRDLDRALTAERRARAAIEMASRGAGH